MRVVLTESVDKKHSTQVVAVERADGKNSGMEQVYLFDDMRHRHARAETSIERFGDEGDLSVGAKVFMVLAKALEDSGGGGEGGNDLVIST